MTRPTCRRRTPRRSAASPVDRGSATGWAIGVVTIALLLAALIVDVGGAMSAKAHAMASAQQAARAGADQLDLATLRSTGQLRLDPVAAESAAAAWLRRADTSGTATATTTRVEVTVTVTQPALLLAAVGKTTYTLRATATATPIRH